MKTFLMITLAAGLFCAVSLAQEPNGGANAGKTTPAKQATEPGDTSPNDGADARAPEPDARRVDVTVTDGKVEMPTDLQPGKTAFVVKNNGNTTQTFEVRGGGIDRKFITPAAPGDTKVLHADLKSGTTYTVYSVKNDSEMRTKEITLHVK